MDLRKLTSQSISSGMISVVAAVIVLLVLLNFGVVIDFIVDVFKILLFVGAVIGLVLVGVFYFKSKNSDGSN